MDRRWRARGEVHRSRDKVPERYNVPERNEPDIQLYGSPKTPHPKLHTEHHQTIHQEQLLRWCTLPSPAQSHLTSIPLGS